MTPAWDSRTIPFRQWIMLRDVRVKIETYEQLRATVRLFNLAIDEDETNDR